MKKKLSCFEREMSEKPTKSVQPKWIRTDRISRSCDPHRLPGNRLTSASSPRRVSEYLMEGDCSAVQCAQQPKVSSVLFSNDFAEVKQAKQIKQNQRFRISDSKLAMQSCRSCTVGFLSGRILVGSYWFLLVSLPVG